MIPPHISTGQKSAAAGTTNDHGELLFSVRWCSEITAVNLTEYRILFRGEIYNILTIDPMNYSRVTVKIMARKEAR